MGEDRDEDRPAGLSEAASELERVTKVKMMDDATLLHTYRALSGSTALQPSTWLTLVEQEIEARGLRSIH